MYTILLCSILCIYRIASAQMDVDSLEFESDLSPHTFFELTNGSKEYKPFNVTDFELLTRRQWAYNLYHVGTKEHIGRACYYLVTTYKTALTDFRRYFPLRYLYVETLEYEVGYLTHEIVSRYQNMIELYHLIQRRFEQQAHRNVAPAPYMLYIYMNILELSKVVLHLCNMMHEVELKYKVPPLGIFNDVVAPKFDNLPAEEALARQEAYEKRMKQLRKEQARERRKIRKQNLEIGKLFTPIYQRQPNKSRWPRNYGWSIELWW